MRDSHRFALLLIWSSTVPLAYADAAPQELLLRKLCVDCHNNESAEAGVNIQRLIARDSFATDFRTWRRITKQLEQKWMPPQDAVQPKPAQRQAIVSWIKQQISAAAAKHDGDPGQIVIRRLTSAEYSHAIHDLTGAEIRFARDFVSDAVGGAGFTNTGLVQFTQDSTLERYLEAARRVAGHAVVGAGPLSFFQDPGKTGFELSAINRIQHIYRTHGFRRAAGEGGEAFGLEMYPKALLVAWKYRYRNVLGRQDATLPTFAREGGINVRFAEFISEILTRPRPSFPTSEIIHAWHRLPKPSGPQDTAIAKLGCDKIADLLRDWQNRFGSNTDAKEEAPVLRADTFDVQRTQLFEMNINWPKGTKTAHLVMSVESANKNGDPDAVIKWNVARIQFRDYAKRLADPQPLRDSLSAKAVKRLGFGQHPRGGKVDQNGFVTVGTKPPAFELPIPEGARSARMLVTAELDIEHGEDCIVRCRIAQLEETDQGKSVSGLLANPHSKEFAAWKADVLEFASLFPQSSQQEPAPSDRDPIPAPIDATYNNAERNFFHTRIKYFRDDQFLVDNILSKDARDELDRAWADLLGSFEFHDTWLQLLARKYELKLDGRGMADVDAEWIEQAPVTARPYLRRLKTNFDQGRAMFKAAEGRHVEDVLSFASLAWRRPLSTSERSQLQNFYRTLRTSAGLDHRDAVCATIARVLVAPSFLYRTERTRQDGQDAVTPLTQWELASRLSFLLWSSVPDNELRRAAAANELRTNQQIIKQTRRMLQDAKSRRFATEFFGQWFGFYRFDEFGGVDSEMFPEFSTSLQQSMYDEAIVFFDHIVRANRPVNEILFADYAFVNDELAKHYGLEVEVKTDELQRVSGANSIHRGGLLRLGAVLATTSAPRRTSPVKRGDWILRRVLGTAVPPPPADAGSISADEVTSDGATIRQRLQAHRREASCHNCHARFDAFGFALENYDPLGRWREEYRDRKPVETTGELRDGTSISGDRGLHKYLRQQQGLFHETLARKLIGYALGRQDAVGDSSLVSALTMHMARDGGMLGLIEAIVTSRQFRHRRAD